MYLGNYVFSFFSLTVSFCQENKSSNLVQIMESCAMFLLAGERNKGEKMIKFYLLFNKHPEL